MEREDDIEEEEIRGEEGLPPRAEYQKRHSANLQRNCLATELSRTLSRYTTFLDQESLNFKDRFDEDEWIIRQVMKYLTHVLTDVTQGYVVGGTEETAAKLQIIKEDLEKAFISDALETVSAEGACRVASCLKDDVCAICLEKFGGAEEPCKIKSCDHVFHRGCLKIHLARELRCPTCRKDISQDVWKIVK